ncbi:hypothetical protein WA158_005943 [Blastocystis sp. Blastoise]
MSTSDFQLTEEKYETKLWISKEFIEKYQQFSFYDIIQHTEKYDDGSYYMDIPSLSMNKVISFFMKKNKDIDSLNLRDSFDIYKTLLKHSVTLDKEIQSDLLFHLKELFYNYLKDNNYDVPGYYCEDKKLHMPMELYNLEKKKICIQGLIIPQQKEELFYYSLLIKMMNITTVEIEYDYSSNIPIEYICPSCIKDIFPSLEIIDIYANTHYKKTELLLNPNSDEYIMEYIRLLYKDESRISKRKKYEYYTESEMNEYTKISSLDLNKIYYSHDIIDSYNDKRQKNELPKLYKDIVKEAIYTSDYSNVEISETEDEYIFNDQVSIEYHDKTNDKTFIIDQVSTEHGISQLLLLPSYLSISKIILRAVVLEIYFNYQAGNILKLFEEGLFDSLTILSIDKIRQITNGFNKNLLNKIMTTHVFPNVTELIYDDKSFQLSKINKQCFPKLHIINFYITIEIDDFDSLLPDNLISVIDTIHININNDEKEEIIRLLENKAYSHSIHIDGTDISIYDWIYYFPHLNKLLKKDLIVFHNLSIDLSHSENIKKLDSIENYKQNIDCLDIKFIEDDPYEIDKRNSLERFLKSNVLQHLNDLIISFHDNISIEYLTWISTLFNDNKFNNIHELTINLYSIPKASSSEYLTAYENILEKIIPKSFIVNIEGCTMSFINRLIPKGCFHNTTQLILGIYILNEYNVLILVYDILHPIFFMNIYLEIKDMPDDDFCKLYTTNNFPQLKYIKICISINNNNILYYKSYKDGINWWSSFMETFCRYINKNNFPSSSIVRLTEWNFSVGDDCFNDDSNDAFDNDYVYDPDYSIFRCKYDSHSCMNTIIGTKAYYKIMDIKMNIYEIETLFECINHNKTQNIKSLKLRIYSQTQLSNLIKFITKGKFPKLKELILFYGCRISYEQIHIYKQQLDKYTHIHKNLVDYQLIEEK